MELAAVLASPEFAASRRSCEFLLYVVQAVFDGRPDLLKERTIGVALFGREAAYDTGSDAAVRVRANHVRRRLRAYYERCAARRGWRIAMRPGSYAPRFVPESEVRAVLTYVPGAQPALVIQGASADCLRETAQCLTPLFGDGAAQGTLRRLAGD